MDPLIKTDPRLSSLLNTPITQCYTVMCPLDAQASLPRGADSLSGLTAKYVKSPGILRIEEAISGLDGASFYSGAGSATPITALAFVCEVRQGAKGTGGFYGVYGFYGGVFAAVCLRCLRLCLKLSPARRALAKDNLRARRRARCSVHRHWTEITVSVIMLEKSPQPFCAVPGPTNAAA